MKLQPVSVFGGHCCDAIWRTELHSQSLRMWKSFSCTCDIFDVLSVGVNRISPEPWEATQVTGRATCVCDKRSDMGSIDVWATVPRCCRPWDVKAPSAGGRVGARGMTLFAREQKLCVNIVLGSRRWRYSTERPYRNRNRTNFKFSCYSQRNNIAFAYCLHQS